jgi:glycosyltransferase involved in cell wall biosynthesis
LPDLVSILIPAYNAEQWLAETIRSAMAQTWPRTEIIVVDDGSRDGTLAVAKAFESSRVKVVTQPNMGAPAARNKAFALAQGTYIQWLDADDLLDPRKIRVQMDAAREIADPRVLLSGPFGTFYYRPEKAVFTPTSLWRELTPIEYFLARFRDNVFFQTGAWLVSRELSEAAGLWTDYDSPDDDGEYFCRVAMKSARISFVDGARIYYRVGNYGALNKARSDRAQTALFGSKVKCIKYLLSMEDSERSRAACVQLLQDWLPELLPHRPDLVAEAKRLAGDMGGHLAEPVLKWKYRPVEWLCGREAAMRATRILPRLRGGAARRWDRLLYRRSGSAGSPVRRAGEVTATGARP